MRDFCLDGNLAPSEIEIQSWKMQQFELERSRTGGSFCLLRAEDDSLCCISTTSLGSVVMGYQLKISLSKKNKKKTSSHTNRNFCLLKKHRIFCFFCLCTVQSDTKIYFQPSNQQQRGRRGRRRRLIDSLVVMSALQTTEQTGSVR